MSGQWDDDLVQFARLLCELQAADTGNHGEMRVSWEDVQESMDLGLGHIDELFERAGRVWAEAVGSRPPEGARMPVRVEGRAREGFRDGPGPAAGGGEDPPVLQQLVSRAEPRRLEAFCPKCGEIECVVEPNYNLQWLRVWFTGDPKDPDVEYDGMHGDSYPECSGSVEEQVTRYVTGLKELTEEMKGRLSKRFLCTNCDAEFDMPNFEPVKG